MIKGIVPASILRPLSFEFSRKTIESHQNSEGGYLGDDLNVSQTMSTDSKDSFDEENNERNFPPAQSNPHQQSRHDLADAESHQEHRTVTKSSLMSTNNTSSSVSIMGFADLKRDRLSNNDDDSSSSNSGVHNYVNANAQNEISCAKQTQVRVSKVTDHLKWTVFFNSLFPFQYCKVLYTFDALDESTLSVVEGEYLKVVQKHDDNMNDEWWLLERLTEESSTNDSLNNDNKTQTSLTKDRGYVPSNYIKLLNNDEIINLTVVQSSSGDSTTTSTDDNHNHAIQMAATKNSNLFEFINKPDARSNGERNFL